MALNVDQLREVQFWCRAHFEPDMARFNHGPDYWMGPEERKIDLSEDDKVNGVCIDFALLAREELWRIGIENRLVICYTEPIYDQMDDETKPRCHAVTEVEGWILDCRRLAVERRDDIPYQWTMISGFKPGEDWVEIVK